MYRQYKGKKKKKNRDARVCKTLHRKLNTGQQEPLQKTEVDLGAPEG